MATTPDEIVDAALQLPESDQILIVRRLLERLPSEPLDSMSDEEFEAELDRRSGDFEGSVDWEDFREELRRRRQ